MINLLEQSIAKTNRYKDISEKLLLKVDEAREIIEKSHDAQKKNAYKYYNRCYRVYRIAKDLYMYYFKQQSYLINNKIGISNQSFIKNCVFTQDWCIRKIKNNKVIIAGNKIEIPKTLSIMINLVGDETKVFKLSYVWYHYLKDYKRIQMRREDIKTRKNKANKVS